MTLWQAKGTASPSVTLKLVQRLQGKGLTDIEAYAAEERAIEDATGIAYAGRSSSDVVSLS